MLGSHVRHEIRKSLNSCSRTRNDDRSAGTLVDHLGDDGFCCMPDASLVDVDNVLPLGLWDVLGLFAKCEDSRVCGDNVHMSQFRNTIVDRRLQCIKITHVSLCSDHSTSFSFYLPNSFF